MQAELGNVEFLEVLEYPTEDFHFTPIVFVDVLLQLVKDVEEDRGFQAELSSADRYLCG